MIKKQFLKTKPVCKATLTLPVEAAPEAAEVKIVGEFNDWNPSSGIVMKKQKNGIFKATINLESGREYEFKYLADGEQWLNDWEADKYVAGAFGSENSVISTLS